MAKVGDIINDTWLIRKRVGRGSFCNTYVASTIDSLHPSTGLDSSKAKYVAIKIPHEDSTFNLQWESEVLKGLLGITWAPSFIHHGKYKSHDFVVMELLLGEDMAHFRDRIRTITEFIPIPIAVCLTKQILYGIKAMHDRGYIHRDIKPANFVRKNNQSLEFCIIDFGITKQYMEKDGHTMRQKRDKAEFRGTTLYASPFVHQKEDQCCRDDLYSMLFVFLDLITGKLPWSEAAYAKDKVKVAELKEEYCFNPNHFVTWITEVLKAPSRSNSNGANQLLVFDENVKQKIVYILSYLNSLKYEDVPKYDDLIDKFNEMIPTDAPKTMDTAHPAYTLNNFTYDNGTNKLSNIEEEMRIDILLHIKIIKSKLHNLKRLLVTSSDATDTEKANPMAQSIFTLFEKLIRELLKFPEKIVNRDLIGSYKAIISDVMSFFDIKFDEDSSYWGASFRVMQELLYKFDELEVKVNARYVDELSSAAEDEHAIKKQKN